MVQVLRHHGFRVLGLELAEENDLQVSQVVGTSRDAALTVAQILVLHEYMVDPNVSSDADVIVTVGRDLLP